jgi:integrase
MDQIYKNIGDVQPKYNPVNGVRIVSDGVNEEDDPPKPFTESDLAVLLSDGVTKYHDHYAVAVATGVRRGELCAL